MSSADYAREVVEKLQAAGVAATCDPRGAQVPCVLVEPPSFANYDSYCDTARGTWNAFCLVPSPLNLDTWDVRCTLEAAVASVLPVTTAQSVLYSLSPDSPSVPALQMSWEGSYEL